VTDVFVANVDDMADRDRRVVVEVIWKSACSDWAMRFSPGRAIVPIRAARFVRERS